MPARLIAVLLALLTGPVAAVEAPGYAVVETKNKRDSLGSRVLLLVVTETPPARDQAVAIVRHILATRIDPRGLVSVETRIRARSSAATDPVDAQVLWSPPDSILVNLAREEPAPEVTAPAPLPAPAPTPPPAVEPGPEVPASAEVAPSAEVQLRDVVERWRSAWEARDLDRYMGFYAAGFSGDGLDVGAWRARKQAVFAAAGAITVAVAIVDVAVDGDHATVSFDQTYRSDRKSDFGRKTLGLAREAGEWRIVSEAWLPSARPE